MILIFGSVDILSFLLEFFIGESFFKEFRMFANDPKSRIFFSPEMKVLWDLWKVIFEFWLLGKFLLESLLFESKVNSIDPDAAFLLNI